MAASRTPRSLSTRLTIRTLPMSTTRNPRPIGSGAFRAAPSAANAALSVEHLTKRYDGRAVVDDLSFAVAPGEIFALLGPNGAGKTTTVEILEGYRKPDGGSARVLGLDPMGDAA